MKKQIKLVLSAYCTSIFLIIQACLIYTSLFARKAAATSEKAPDTQQQKTNKQNKIYRLESWLQPFTGLWTQRHDFLQYTVSVWFTSYNSNTGDGWKWNRTAWKLQFHVFHACSSSTHQTDITTYMQLEYAISCVANVSRACVVFAYCLSVCLSRRSMWLSLRTC